VYFTDEALFEERADLLAKALLTDELGSRSTRA
jgi:hypothetical protein